MVLSKPRTNILRGVITGKKYLWPVFGVALNLIGGFRVYAFKRARVDVAVKNNMRIAVSV
jgi:hypothetical protein